MSKCNNCQFNEIEFDGEAIPRYDGGFDGEGTWVSVCSKGQTKHHEESGLNCKKHKAIESKCYGCKSVIPLSQLNQGFCSEQCKKIYIENVKKIVVKDEIRLTEINNRISELKLEKKTSVDEVEWMDLKLELQGVEHYLEEGKDILKKFGTVI